MPSTSSIGSPSISMRSAKVPESPSSALQTMYFCSPGASSTVCHLMPAGNAAPPRPRSPDAVTSSTISLRGHAERALQSREATVRTIARAPTPDRPRPAGRTSGAAASSGTGSRPPGRGIARSGYRRPASPRPAGAGYRPAVPDRRRCAARRPRPPAWARARTPRASRCARCPPGGIAARLAPAARATLSAPSETALVSQGT